MAGFPWFRLLLSEEQRFRETLRNLRRFSWQKRSENLRQKGISKSFVARFPVCVLRHRRRMARLEFEVPLMAGGVQLVGPCP